MVMFNGRLTPSEEKICEKIIKGKSNREISEELFISEKTVKTHIHNILLKLNLKSRHQVNFIWEQYKNTSEMYGKYL